MTNTFRRAWPLALAFGVGGCATINVHADPMARQAGRPGAARVVLYGSKATIDNLRVYENGSAEPLKIVMVNNPSFKEVAKNSFNEMNAAAQANAQAAATGFGMARYTTTTRYSPAIFLDTKGTHSLRMVRSDGQEATVVLKPHVGKSYVVLDWLIAAPTIFTSLIIDAKTGKWNSYSAIDIDKHLPATASSQDGRR